MQSQTPHRRLQRGDQRPGVAEPQPRPIGGSRQPRFFIAAPVYDYENHLGVDGEFGFLNRYSLSHATALPGAHVSALRRALNGQRG